MVGRHTQTQSYFSSVSLSLMSCLSLGCCSIGLHNFLHNENQRTSSSDRDLFFDGATMDFLHCTQEGSRVWVEKNPNYNKASVFWQNQFFIAKMKLLGQLKTFPNHTFSLNWNMLLINSEFFSILWPGITKFFLALCSKNPKSLWNYMGRSTQIFSWFLF